MRYRIFYTDSMLRLPFLPPLLVLLLSGCLAQSPVYTVMISDSGEWPAERAFLDSALAETELAALGMTLVPEEAAVVVELLSFWESDPLSGSADEGGSVVPLARTWYVPQADALAGRQDASPADCREGRETLVPLQELAPPFTALRVNGMSVDDPQYPLRRITGVRVRPADRGGAELQGSASEKAAALEGVIRNRARSLLAGPPEMLWIASAGDLMLGRGAERILLDEGAGGLLGEAAALFRDADLALVNLEGAVSSRGTRAKKAFNFRFSPAVAAPLRKAGIDAVLLANNHAFDWGIEGFLDTLDHLEQAGIGVLGAGRDEDAAGRPFVFRKGNAGARVFGLASYPVERSGWDGRSAAAGVNRPGMLHTRSGGAGAIKVGLVAGGTSGDLQAVLFHGGDEWSSRPNRATRELCRDLVRAGADLIIGSHPHLVQGFEWLEGKPVFWSLGNFVFAGMENTGGGDKGLGIRLGFWGKRLIYLEPFPLSLTGPRTAIAPREELAGFYDRSRELRGGH
ncbi:MAG: CapA family protein [Treponema sp.]|nr:CapA family protein [Treponema sp.]